MLIYYFSICLYRWGIFLFSFFNSKARFFIQGRKGIFQKLREEFQKNKKPVLWIHAASLGEFEQGRPVIEKIRVQFPQFIILLTFFSPSGYQVMQHYDKVDFVCYLPIDSPSNARRFIQIVQPRFVIFIKYEFWHFYIARLRAINIPIISVSSIFREEQIYFKIYGHFYRKILRNISHFFVQNQESAQLLQGIGITQVSISGDTRFDRAVRILSGRENIPMVEKFSASHQTLVIGSSWQPDIMLNALVIRDLNINLKIIVAPHEITEKNIQHIKKSFAYQKIVLFSQVRGIDDLKQKNLLIIDNVGMLSKLYRYADIAFIGGGFYKNGLHNILEAATYGVPVVFGRYFRKFHEARSLVDLGGAFCVHEAKELKILFRKFLTEESFRKKTGDICSKYIRSGVGATNKVMKYLIEHLVFGKNIKYEER